MNKTVPDHEKTQAYFAELAGRRAEDAPLLDAVFRRASGFEPVLWTGGILGYGAYDYEYKSGRTGTCFATGFAPKKAKISIHIMPGLAEHGEILARLGKHKSSVSCVYVNKLADIDLDVLETLIRAGLEDLHAQWPVRA